MVFSEVLTYLEDNYPPGCSEYYATMNPDLWSHAYEELGTDLLSDEGEKRVKFFHETIVRLIAEYKKNPRHQAFPWSVVMHSKSEDSHKKMSVQDKYCWSCLSDKNIRAAKTSFGYMSICKDCEEAAP